MKTTPTAIADVLVIEPKVFGDARGFFFESFNQKAFNEAVGQDITLSNAANDFTGAVAIAARNAAVVLGAYTASALTECECSSGGHSSTGGLEDSIGIIQRKQKKHVGVLKGRRTLHKFHLRNVA